MKLIVPDNIFSKMISFSLPENGIELLNQKSSFILKDLESNPDAVAMLPSLDLINQRNLFISKKYAVSFTGALSNSYLRFVEGQKDFKKIYMIGDYNLNDAILAKILFTEKYSSTIELVPDKESKIDDTKNYLISGDNVFANQNIKTSVSFADLISDMLDMPYINFVFASQNIESLKEFNVIMDNICGQIKNNIASVLEESTIDNLSKVFILENIDYVNYDVTKNEIYSLSELIKLLFFHGIIDDIFEVKYV